MSCETVHSRFYATFFRHSAVLSLATVLLHKLPIYRFPGHSQRSHLSQTSNLQGKAVHGNLAQRSFDDGIDMVRNFRENSIRLFLCSDEMTLYTILDDGRSVLSCCFGRGKMLMMFFLRLERNLDLLLL